MGLELGPIALNILFLCILPRQFKCYSYPKPVVCYGQNSDYSQKDGCDVGDGCHSSDDWWQAFQNIIHEHAEMAECYM